MAFSYLKTESILTMLLLSICVNRITNSYRNLYTSKKNQGFYRLAVYLLVKRGSINEKNSAPWTVLNLFYTGNRSQVICLNQPNIRSEIWRRSLSYLAIPSLTSESLKAFKSESTIDCWMNVKEHLETGAISEV